MEKRCWQHRLLERRPDWDNAKLALRPSGDGPTHSLADGHAESKWALYSRAAGAVVALRILRRADYIALDYSDLLPRIHDAYLKHPDYGYQTGLQLVEIGILTPAVLVDPDELRLHSLVTSLNEQ